jgi:hypothetical protein
MAKCMQCGGSKKMGYMDLGGNFVDMSNKYQAVEPTSGYGTSDANKCPPNCEGPGAKHARTVRNRQAQRTKEARKNIGKCRR